MADVVLHGDVQTGLTLYFQVWNAAGQVWNGSTFVSYNAGNWADYDTATAEQGASKIYKGNFPASITAGLYTIITFEQPGAAPVEGDTIAGMATQEWDGSAFLVLKAHGATNWKTITAATVSAAVLSTPGNKLGVNGSGEVVASNTAAIATAVWAAGTRTLSSFGSLATDVATSVWAAGTRTLSSFGSLAADAATSVWAAGTRVLTANTNLNDPTSAENAAAVWAAGTRTLTANTNLNDLNAAAVKAAVQATIIDGSTDLQAALTRIMASTSGRIVKTSSSPLIFDIYEQDGATVAFVLTQQLNGSERTVT